jgi:hypothetical protein
MPPGGVAGPAQNESVAVFESLKAICLSADTVGQGYSSARGSSKAQRKVPCGNCANCGNCLCEPCRPPLADRNNGNSAKRLTRRRLLAKISVINAIRAARLIPENRTRTSGCRATFLCEAECAAMVARRKTQALKEPQLRAVTQRADAAQRTGTKNPKTVEKAAATPICFCI